MKENNNEPLFLPININVTDKNILFIGGGKVALNKINQLLKFTNNITVVAKHICDEIKELPINWSERSYTHEILEEAFLIYACTNDFELNKKIYTDARNTGKLINRVDCPAETDFTSPAIYKKDNMVVAVSSNGKDLKKTIKWRNIIKDNFEKSFTD